MLDKVNKILMDSDDHLVSTRVIYTRGTSGTKCAYYDFECTKAIETFEVLSELFFKGVMVLDKSYNNYIFRPNTCQNNALIYFISGEGAIEEVALVSKEDFKPM